MYTMTDYLKDELMSYGADLVGFADLKKLPSYMRFDMPVGIAVAVRYPSKVIRGITDMPTKEYFEQYKLLNEKLDNIVTYGANTLKMLKYKAIAQTTEYVSQWEMGNETMLPHKTVATRAGLGWIGKSALFVNDEYGSMIRLSSILTDAPLKTAKPVNKSKCGKCKLCTQACPAGAVMGKNWSVKKKREEIFNADLCKKVARERSMQSIGEVVTLCGKCIVVCPYTQKYLESDD